MTGKTALPLQRWRIGLAGHGPAAPAQPVRPKPWCHPTMSTAELATELFEIAERARRLPPPSHRNPEAFHEARSELAHDIEVLAQQLNPPMAVARAYHCRTLARWPHE